MEAFSGKYKIIESGSVIPYDENSGIELHLKLNDDFSVKLNLTFEENGKERDIEKNIDEINNIVSYKCINFGDGAGTIEPLELATASGKRVCFHFWVQKLSSKNSVRRIDYTVFMER